MPPDSIFHLGGQGPNAASLLYEVVKRVTADLAGWPKIQRARELREPLSLSLVGGIAAQLRVRNAVVQMMEED